MDQNPPSGRSIRGQTGAREETVVPSEPEPPAGLAGPEPEPPAGPTGQEPLWSGQRECEPTWARAPEIPAEPEWPAQTTCVGGPGPWVESARSAEPTEVGEPQSFVDAARSAEHAGAPAADGVAEQPAFPEPPGPIRRAEPSQARGFPRLHARPTGDLPAAIYWRRRVIALALGISVVAILVWAVNGTLSVPTPGNAASSAGPGGIGAGVQDGTGSGALPAQDAGNAGSVGAGQGTRGGASAPGWQAASSPSARPGRVASAGPLAASRGRQGSGARAVPACARGDVVISLLTRRRWYGPTRRPEFLAEAVSTGSQPCGFNVGTRFLSVVVAAGRARIWSSADCARQRRSRVVVLTRGVPAAIWTSWNRKSTRNGCQTGRRRVRPGTYTATAVAPYRRSTPIVFVLSGPGVAGPLRGVARPDLGCGTLSWP
jgi:hypothetical protein